MGGSSWGGRSVSRIISVFSGNRAKLVGLDRVSAMEFARLQEAANAAAPVAPTIRRNPRRFMKLTPTACDTPRYSIHDGFHFPVVRECTRNASIMNCRVDAGKQRRPVAASFVADFQFHSS